jgi:hypothetical protein
MTNSKMSDDQSGYTWPSPDEFGYSNHIITSYQIALPGANSNFHLDDHIFNFNTNPDTHEVEFPFSGWSNPLDEDSVSAQFLRTLEDPDISNDPPANNDRITEVSVKLGSPFNSCPTIIRELSNPIDNLCPHNQLTPTPEPPAVNHTPESNSVTLSDWEKLLQESVAREPRPAENGKVKNDGDAAQSTILQFLAQQAVQNTRTQYHQETITTHLVDGIPTYFCK